MITLTWLSWPCAIMLRYSTLHSSSLLLVLLAISRFWPLSPTPLLFPAPPQLCNRFSSHLCCCCCAALLTSAPPAALLPYSFSAAALCFSRAWCRCFPPSLAAFPSDKQGSTKSFSLRSTQRTNLGALLLLRHLLYCRDSTLVVLSKHVTCCIVETHWDSLFDVLQRTTICYTKNSTSTSTFLYITAR